MRLKRLDVVGFKSFLDRTVVRFDDGVTGIVGPNGCGKSNIVDAVRWVLGEQSPKHLRGSSMQDVIFSGSQTRPPVSMAEVTLTFVNDRPDEVPARFRAFSEIAITRRLFRNGDSEYLINKTPCRLMDIVEVFLGTGVGTKAYSIIEQGRIGLIVSAKAEDRRSLIEEAAGITRYKSKRKLAERKMEHTRANLLRVGDLVGELQKRLDSLGRQAKKAERYKRLKAELGEVELYLSAHRWLEIAAIRRHLERDLEAVRARAKRVTEEVAALEKDVRSRRDKVVAEETRLAGVQAGAAELEGRANVHRERAAGLGRERESLGTRAKQAREEIAELTERQARLVKAAAEDKELLEKLDAALADSRALLDKSSKELSEASVDVNRLTSLAEIERQGATKAGTAITRGESQVAAIARRREELDQRKELGAKDMGVLRTRLDELRQAGADNAVTLDDARERHQSIAADRAAAVESLNTCKAALAEVETEVRRLKDLLAEKRSRLVSLEDIQRNYEGYESGVRSIMLERERVPGLEADAVLGLVADLVSAKPPHEAAIEAVLGESLQHILVTDQDAARSAITWLTEGESGRSAFIPRLELRARAEAPPELSDLAGERGFVAHALDVTSCQPENEAIVRHLLGGVVIVEDLDAGLRIWSRLERVTCVTLAGEVVSESGTISGGTRDSASAGLLKARREIEELRGEVQVLVASLETRGADSARLQREKGELAEKLERLSQSLHAEQINIVGLEKEAQRASDELTRLQERIVTLEAETKRVDKALAESDAERASVEVATAQARVALEAHTGRGKELEEELSAARSRVSEMQEALTRLRVTVAEDSQRRDALTRQIKRAESDGHEITERLRRLASTIEGSAARHGEIEQTIARDAAEAARLQAEAEAMRAALTRGRESVQTASRAVKADEERLDAMRGALEEDQQEVKRLEMDAREMAIEAEHITEAVTERHATSISDAVHDWHLSRAPGEDDVDRLESLRSKVDRIGEVNLTAIQEYDEIAERHGFLSAQKEDLESSLDQLDKAITRIDKTSKARFKETFERVDELFRQVFPRLFKGGKAGLSLTDPMNPLDSGVEIFAQPPGKKLQNVSLLSGGEKALTAVALVFAIFLVRPTPFCLLDEVDAPLDESNVQRYNQLVREMSRHSQFILVTHNKHTMEVSDTLYGVTMEEPGVSKLVSVKLSDEGPTAVAA